MPLWSFLAEHCGEPRVAHDGRKIPYVIRALVPRARDNHVCPTNMKRVGFSQETFGIVAASADVSSSMIGLCRLSMSAASGIHCFR